jgi:hypothetical protein
MASLEELVPVTIELMTQVAYQTRGDHIRFPYPLNSSLSYYLQVIKRPPMSEKLLRRPPFRFLHDTISEVIKTSGFLEGLFSGDEKVYNPLCSEWVI